MKKPWQYIVNQFVNSTNENYTKAFKLSNYHDAYLNKMQTENPTETDWAILYNRYHPFHLQYVSIYTAWKNAGGQRSGQTLNLDQLLELLITKVNKWDALIQTIDSFEKGTPNYLSIFPQGRFPFNSGGKTQRVEAVNVLVQNMAAYAAIPVSTRTLVSDFYTLLDTARDTQEGAKGGTKLKSQEVDQKRIAVMTEQFRDLGFLINKFAEQPKFIAPFFDLNVLRESRQTEFTSTLDPMENEAVLIHTFAADDELQLQVTAAPSSGTPLPIPVEFYLATTANGTDSTVVSVVPKAAAITITAADFGITDYAAHRYLTVVNPNVVECRYVVELL
jgi:hypothetical protein